MQPLLPLLGAALVFLSATGLAHAQADTWPPEQVSIIVPYPPGSEPDALARDISHALTQKTGKTFVVENRPGANAIVGSSYVARDPGNGATLLMIDRLALVTNPLLYSNVPFDWKTAFKPITDIAEVQLYVAVNNKFPADDYKGFIEYARANPGRVDVATGGNGHVTHIGMEMLARSEGVEFNYVPYKGITPAMMDTLGGQADAIMAGGLVMATNRANGGIKILATGGNIRHDLLADVPTLEQAGGKPGSIPTTFFSLLAPSGVPDDTVQKIRDMVVEVIQEDKLRNAYESRGLVIAGTQPADMRAAMEKDEGRYREVIEAAGIQVN